MEKINGRLENWYFDGVMIHGDIYDDPDKRFPEGCNIHTSRLKNLDVTYKEGDIIETRNSRYLLGKILQINKDK